jgi:hypothetical protein
MSPAGATSAGNGPQHPHSGNGPPPLSGGCGLDRAGPSNRRSTIGMKDAGLLFPSQSMDWVKALFTDGPDPQNAGFAALPRPKKEQRKEAHSALDANTIM